MPEHWLDRAARTSADTPAAQMELDVLYYDDAPRRLPDVVWDRRRKLFVAGSTYTHVVDLMPQLFDEFHVGLTPKTEFEFGRFGVARTPPPGLDAVWLYRSFEEALAAVNAWSWMTEDEPPNYRKRAV